MTKAKLQTFLGLLQIYFIFASFLRKKEEELLKGGSELSKDNHVNEGKFVLNFDVLFAL